MEIEENADMDINLAGKTALVTGGNAGIGRAIALALARCSADVAVTRFSHDDPTTGEIRAMGHRAISFHLDATDSGMVNQVMAQAAQELGGHIDILINNAGHLVGRVPIAEMTDEHWHQVIHVNLTSTFYCSRAVLPYMNRGWGRIVNSSSLAAHDGGGAGAAAYAAAKAGIIGLTRGLAKELAPRGITVNAVAPGLIVGTAFHNTFTPKEAQEATIARIPLRRGGTPDDVAGAVLYFCSDWASFVTGDVAEINGGIWFA
jgi:3-oxoacyl-[acyl-carrier protein] reductase